MDSHSSKRNTKNRSMGRKSVENRNLESRTVRTTKQREMENRDIHYRNTDFGRGTRKSSSNRNKRKKIDFISIFFLFMFIYLGVHIIYFAAKERHPLYEVPRAESVDENISFKGFIVRDEVSFTATQRGYINYYIASGRRAAAGATIYTLDEEGEFSKMILSSSSSEQNLSDSDLKKIIQRIKNLQEDFDTMDFQKVYDTKSAISAVVMDALTAAAIEKLNETMGVTGFTRISTDRSGIVSLTSDSYDGLNEENLSLECLKGEGYSKIVSTAGDQKQAGEFVYKLVTDEAFQIYFEMDDDTIREFGLDEETQNIISTVIYLNKIEQDVTADMSIVKMSDGNNAVKLSIAKYGSNYVDDRYVEFEIVRDDIRGIKIPVTSVVEKDYYMIPVDFVPTGEEYSENGVLKKSATGEAVFVEFNSYKVDREAGWYYVWTEELAIGDVLLKADSEETYQIITTEPITGVYEANQGYTKFKIVTILQETNDKKYYLIKPKVSFGISAFDYIVIEASKVTEGQVLE